MGVRLNATAAAASSLDARAEAKKIAFDRIGHGNKVPKVFHAFVD